MRGSATRQAALLLGSRAAACLVTGKINTASSALDFNELIRALDACPGAPANAGKRRGATRKGRHRGAMASASVGFHDAQPGPASSPRENRAALFGEEVGHFDREYRQVMADAAESLDLRPSS
jgi:hypothetical protein